MEKAPANAPYKPAAINPGFRRPKKFGKASYGEALKWLKLPELGEKVANVLEVEEPLKHNPSRNRVYFNFVQAIKSERAHSEAMESYQSQEYLSQL